MKLCLKAVIILAVVTLAAGSLVELAQAGAHQNCSCCNNKCQGSKNCHENTKACLCSHQAPLQVYLLKSETLPKLEFCGFFAVRPGFAYVYLSAEDIFHPPKLKLSWFIIDNCFHKRSIFMKRYLFVLTFIISMFFISSYALAAETCCVKNSCACAKGSCCSGGQCACKGSCCSNGSCKCGQGSCGTKCNC